MGRYPTRPLPADYVRMAVREIVAQISDQPVNYGLLGAFIGCSNTFIGGDQRRAVLGYLFRDDHKPMSSRDLTGREVRALIRWSGITKNEATKKWETGEFFAAELLYTARAALAELVPGDPPTEDEIKEEMSLNTYTDIETGENEKPGTLEDLDNFMLRGK